MNGLAAEDWVRVGDELIVRSAVQSIKANYEAGVVTVRTKDGIGRPVFPNPGESISDCAKRVVSLIAD